MSIMFPENWWETPAKWFGSIDEQFADFNRSKLNIYEDQTHLYVEAALPGLEADEIQVTLDHGRLDIKGQKEDKKEDKNKRFYRRSLQNFHYSTLLPSNIREHDSAQAELKNGILQLKFPKKEESKPQKIEIKTT